MRVCVRAVFFFCGVCAVAKKVHPQHKNQQKVQESLLTAAFVLYCFYPELFGCDRTQTRRRITSTRAREGVGARGRVIEKKV